MKHTEICNASSASFSEFAYIICNLLKNIHQNNTRSLWWLFAIKQISGFQSIADHSKAFLLSKVCNFQGEYEGHLSAGSTAIVS